MPRFYFDVREGASFTRDEVGLDFDSLDAAEQDATCAAAEIGRDRLPNGETCQVAVEVRNGQDQRVLTVKVSLEIDRLEPPPKPSTGATQQSS